MNARKMTNVKLMIQTEQGGYDTIEIPGVPLTDRERTTLTKKIRAYFEECTKRRKVEAERRRERAAELRAEADKLEGVTGSDPLEAAS